jgi:PI-3-kinase-related kinase SMG-1
VTSTVCVQAVLAMGSQESVIADIQERNVQLQASIGQRLKWAAGANPQVAVLLQQFEDSAASHKVIIQVCDR